MTKRWICGACVIRVKGQPAHFKGDVFEFDFANDGAEGAAIVAGSVRLHPDQSGMPVPPPPDDELTTATLTPITEPARRSRGRMRGGDETK